MSRLVGVALVVGALAGGASARPAAQSAPAPASGLWHLLAIDADEVSLSLHHRVDIRLWLPPMDVRAATLIPHTMKEEPFADTSFDGRTLRIRQRPDNWLVMTWDGKRFEGQSVDEKGQPLGGRLKLIPAK